MKHVRFRDLKRALIALGCTVSTSRGGSSHYHAEYKGVSYPIPASHGDNTEISDVYVRGVCRALGLDERRAPKGTLMSDDPVPFEEALRLETERKLDLEFQALQRLRYAVQDHIAARECGTADLERALEDVDRAIHAEPSESFKAAHARNVAAFEAARAGIDPVEVTRRLLGDPKR